MTEIELALARIAVLEQRQDELERKVDLGGADREIVGARAIGEYLHRAPQTVKNWWQKPALKALYKPERWIHHSGRLLVSTVRELDEMKVWLERVGAPSPRNHGQGSPR